MAGARDVEHSACSKSKPFKHVPSGLIKHRAALEPPDHAEKQTAPSQEPCMAKTCGGFGVGKAPGYGTGCEDKGLMLVEPQSRPGFDYSNHNHHTIIHGGRQTQP